MSSKLNADKQFAETGAKQIRYTRPLTGRYYLEKWYRIEEQKNLLPTCETKFITPTQVKFSTSYPAILRDRAFIYLESLGLLRGIISRSMGPTSEMDIEMSANDRSRLASRILWLDMQTSFSGTDVRRFPRYQPANPDSALTLPDGQSAACKIANISPTGAAVISELRPPLQSSIILGQIQGEIRRHMEFGFAVEFLVIQDPATLEKLIAPPRKESDLLILPTKDTSIVK